MSKRSHPMESNEDRWKRKIKEYEAKLEKRKRRRVIYSSGSDSDNADDVQPEEHLNHDLHDGADMTEPHASTESLPSPASPAPLSTPTEPAVDPDLLLALGDCHADTPEWGDDILQDISQRWEPIFKTGLRKEVKDEILKKYLFPKNVPLSKPPVLNPEVSAMLTEACKNRDSRVSSKQGQLGRALAALGKAMSGLLTKTMQSSEVIRILNDTGKLIADSHFLETDTRRSLVMPLLDKSYVSPFKDRQRDKYLFGENLGEFIKSSRGINKTGQLIAPPVPAPSTSSSNLNWRGPPRQRVIRPPAAPRSGGQRAAPAPHRPPAPPPAPRRTRPAPARRPAPQPTSRSRRAT